MAALTPTNPILVSQDTGTMSRVKIKILNGQSWKAGQLLRVDANGYLKAVATDGTQITHYALSDQANPGNTTTEAEVGVLDGDMEFEGNALSQRLAITQIGARYALNVASNIVTIDPTDPTNVSVILTNVGPNWSPAQYDYTDTLQRCRFKILSTVLQATRAA